MTHLLSLSLDDFGASALREQAKRCSLAPADLATRAARYYLADRDSGRMALRVPRLREGPAGEAALRLTVDLDQESSRELEAEARRQDVSVEAMLEHAIMYFLGDLDSGRVERRMLADLGLGPTTKEEGA